MSPQVSGSRRPPRSEGSRIRALLAISTMGGGTGFHLARLLEHRAGGAFEFALHCDGQFETPPPSGVRVYDRTRRGSLHRFPVAQWRQFRALRRTVRAERPDILHTYFFWPIVYGRILRRLGVIRRLVENREDQGFNWGAAEYALLRRTAHVPDRIICVSDAVRDTVAKREGIGAEQLRVIRNGVALPNTSRSGVDETKEELGIPPASPVVGLVANLNRPVKGVRYFVEAVPEILAIQPDTHFLVIGDGPQRPELEARCAELHVHAAVHFLGYRTDMHRLYPVMDVSALTSLSEGLSITILESMSHGLPVVATQVGGNPELVQEGRTGHLVPPRDPVAFAIAVADLIQDPDGRRRMGSAARRRVETEFALSHVASQYDTVYRELLGLPAGTSGNRAGVKP